MSSKDQYRTLEELADELHKEIARIQSGEQAVEQLNRMVEDAREMYERLLIIRHKVYEALTEEGEELEDESPLAFSISGKEIGAPDEGAEEGDQAGKEDPPSQELRQAKEASTTLSPEGGESLDKAQSEVSPNQTSLIDAIEEEEKSLVDHFVEQSDEESLVSQLERSPITDIGQAIGLNQKFQFINELFDGNADAYNKAIEDLNSSDDREAAITQFEQLKKEQSWDDEQVVSDLHELVERRFMTIS